MGYDLEGLFFFGGGAGGWVTLAVAADWEK